MAFHPYPQLIPQVFNPGGFGPPRGLTRASTCPWVDHFASGLEHATQTPYSDSLSLRLPLDGLTSPRTTNSQAHSSKGTPSPRKAPTACRHTVSGTISLPSRGTFHHSLTVLSAIGHQEVFRLRGWSPRIRTGFLGPRATWDSLREIASFRLRGYHPLCRAFQCPSTMTRFSYSLPGW